MLHSAPFVLCVPGKMTTVVVEGRARVGELGSAFCLRVGPSKIVVAFDGNETRGRPLLSRFTMDGRYGAV